MSPMQNPATAAGAVLSADVQQRASTIRWMMFDVDGVLTDGRLWMGPEGEHMKVFDSLDGHGIKLLHEAGIQTAIITGRNSPLVAARARELGMGPVFAGVSDKAAVFAQLRKDHALTAQECGYMGDDWPDLPVLVQAGLACCPAQAHAEVKRRCHVVTQRCGGQGAVREVADLILHAQGHTEHLLKLTLGSLPDRCA